MPKQLRVSIGRTLVDITKTGEVSSHLDTKERHQQRNWEMMIQTMGLRAKLQMVNGPDLIKIDVGQTRFGSNYTGRHKVWTFRFGVELSSQITTNTLSEDFVNIPVITGLDETAEFPNPAFITEGPYTNIYFDSFVIGTNK